MTIVKVNLASVQGSRACAVLAKEDSLDDKFWTEHRSSDVTKLPGDVTS